MRGARRKRRRVSAQEDDLSAAALRYVNPALLPGIRRQRRGKGFAYRGPEGSPVTDRATLRRIRALVIPPAWTDVWICPISNGHLQAVGRDARGRRQYRYHARWRRVRDERKFDRSLAFAEALPRIRKAVEKDLSLPGLTRRKVIATVVRLLESTLARIGNTEYARENRSFGLTTLRTRHVDLNGSEVRFQFRGKGGKDHDVSVKDPRVARVIRRCVDLPGYELFQYIDEDGERRTVDSADVNDYLRETSGADFTAKDFRTWAGTLLATGHLLVSGPARNVRQVKQNVVAAVRAVAEQLGNTPTVCRKCYVHPAIIDAYSDGTLFAHVHPAARAIDDPTDVPEKLVLELLRRSEASGRAAA
ncbi:MAG TPA: DNA topoisomerase IB [Dehalococcoidia bacterium]|nr:DNA topoisomerase IB [Dehalococcoidia bacterium]